jgi:hypothetical protein
MNVDDPLGEFQRKRVPSLWLVSPSMPVFASFGPNEEVRENPPPLNILYRMRV